MEGPKIQISMDMYQHKHMITYRAVTVVVAGGGGGMLLHVVFV